MKAIILDGSGERDRTGKHVLEACRTELEAGGWETRVFSIRELKIGNCAGDFYCWTRTPGMCQINDDNRKVAKALAGSQLAVYLTPVSFGGYSSILKNMIDHQIQNILPFFDKVQGETHHKKRYHAYPRALVVGWMDEPDLQTRAVFAHLVHRNGINFFADKCVSGVIKGNEREEATLASIRRLLAETQNDKPAEKTALPQFRSASTAGIKPRRAVLLVGSPKGRNSTSDSLGSYLFQALDSQGVDTEKIFLYQSRSAEKTEAMIKAINQADLVTLSFPVYVDSLPAPVTEILERIRDDRNHAEAGSKTAFSVITNCGFPEVQHTETAIAICRIFCEQAGFTWAGSLALGGGGMIGGRPLEKVGGQTIRIRKALETAAEALVSGREIPETAQHEFSRKPIPEWMYRMFGDLGWRQEAMKYKTGKKLRERPYSG